MAVPVVATWNLHAATIFFFVHYIPKKNLKSIFITNLKERFPIPNIFNNILLPIVLYFYSVYNNSKELYRIVKINLDPSSEKEVL